MHLPSSLQDAIVIGGGFFGASVAVHLAQQGRRVTLVEQGAGLMQRASLRNQARVHAGYHYPRSLVTALRSITNYPRFRREFAECIQAEFQAFYPIARHGSKVSARQFAAFCRRIGAPVQRAAPAIVKLFQPAYIEDVFAVEECAFDAAKLAGLMNRRLEEHGVTCLFQTTAQRVTAGAAGTLNLAVQAHDGTVQELSTPWVFNCTYSQLNQLPVASGLPLIPLRHELTELALIHPPEELQDKGITVMCGPFFSTMPYPTRGAHTLSHVRYTPHRTWADSAADPYTSAELRAEQLPRETAFPYMVADAARYLPCLSRAQYLDSLWEVKTVLPLSEVDDSRPILFQPSRELPGLVTLMGGKVDNIFDIADELDALTNAVR